jgi:hypothetical protein
MKNKEILNAYVAVEKNLKQEEIIYCLETALEYLKTLCATVATKELKKPFIYQWTFKTEIGSKKEYDCYVKANIYSSTNSLERVIEQIKNSEVSALKSRLLKDFLCDLKPFISYFDKNQDYSWLILNTNTHISNFYLDLANNSFWNGRPSEHPEEKLALSTSTPFIIRQAIEYKIKRILAIDYLMKDKKPFNRTPELCFKVLDRCSKLLKLNNFSFDIIKNIYSWTHAYIHGGYRAEPWKTESALDYLKQVYYSGETTKKNSFSIYAGVEVRESDLSELKLITERVICQENNLEIKWLNQNEVAIIKE